MGMDILMQAASDMMLQQNVNLAYGAKMLQFFVYWPVCNYHPERYEWQAQTFTESEPYLRTSIYDRVREVVWRIQARAFVFAGGEVVKVRHTGEIPRGATRLAPGDMPIWVRSLETSDGGSAVSQIVNGDVEYVVVVNRSPDTELTLRIGLADGVRRVRADGSIVSAALYSSEYWLEPGAMEVFALAPDMFFGCVGNHEYYRPGAGSSKSHAEACAMAFPYDLTFDSRVLNGVPLLKAILSGHEHIAMEERFSPTAVQFMAPGGFAFAGRHVLIT